MHSMIALLLAAMVCASALRGARAECRNEDVCNKDICTTDEMVVDGKSVSAKELTSKYASDAARRYPSQFVSEEEKKRSDEERCSDEDDSTATTAPPARSTPIRQKRGFAIGSYRDVCPEYRSFHLLTWIREWGTMRWVLIIHLPGSYQYLPWVTCAGTQCRYMYPAWPYTGARCMEEYHYIRVLGLVFESGFWRMKFVWVRVPTCCGCHVRHIFQGKK